MQEKFLFEYAVIRVMPRVEREEFLNVGVILYCAKQKFLKSIFTIDQEKLKIFSPETDIIDIKENLLALQKISLGGEGSGTIGCYDIASRFRWLTATRSTVVQCSKVHPGFCSDAQETLIKLHQQLVL
ncbi:DUF3037 domain-containing protein [Pedobacter aquatilis]|uniref:DUF3037 domain-containing protein n=1 Tax=Pedobacter aquatilis TaxID=351343 RepID=UPI0025B56572|nr:DUF3037 domain-containing protein [Pedobacter aquatilis]MDN3585798.1 DUF3037 domain-containing protein [Pedobacter aquatilis]